MNKNDFAKATNGKFWKKANEYPGSAHLVFNSKIPNYPPSSRKNSTRKHSFEDFQASIKDAWDLSEEEFSSFENLCLKENSMNNTHYTYGDIKTMIPNAIHIPQNHSTLKNNFLKHTTPLKSQEIRLYPGHPQPLFVRWKLTGCPITQQWTSKNCKENNRLEKYQAILSSSHVDLEKLRSLSSSGIPYQVRSVTWQLLTGYLPASVERRHQTLQRKRDDYWNYVTQYYESRFDKLHAAMHRQILTDIPRMSPLIPLFEQAVVQKIFERILYIWALRHPASGYVQGINDLVTPFFIVFLFDMIPKGSELSNVNVENLSEVQKYQIEADCFWCTSKLLDTIQDNYTFAQPGIQKKIYQLKELVRRIDDQLHTHLTRHGVDYLQFSFRWMNNLLMREIPLGCIVRLWDSYLAEGDNFPDLHLYVCAAFLIHHSALLLRQIDFQNLMLTLQNLPTQNWNEEDINLLVAEAFRLKYTYMSTPRCL